MLEVSALTVRRSAGYTRDDTARYDVPNDNRS